MKQITQEGTANEEKDEFYDCDCEKEHSEFIGFPIEVYGEKSKDKEVTDSKDGEDEKKEEEHINKTRRSMKSLKIRSS